MGESFDSRLDKLEKSLKDDERDYDQQMVEFANNLRTSKGFRALSDKTKERIDLYIKAYNGDEEAMLKLSELLGDGR